MSFHTRRLPHWQPEGAEFIVTWRLYGSFVAVDRMLDAASTGPVWLKDSRVADCVSGILLAGDSEWRLYQLRAWVLMANHVHVLMCPGVALSNVLMRIKSTTAREANTLLGRKGERFCQAESYDHWVRGGEERDRIVRYIEGNPVGAGLVQAPEDWRWSSAGRGRA